MYLLRDNVGAPEKHQFQFVVSVSTTYTPKPVLPQLVFSTRSGFFGVVWFLGIFVSNLDFFSFITYQNFFPCMKLNNKLSYCRENSALAVQFIVDSVQGHPRSLISIQSKARIRFPNSDHYWSIVTLALACTVSVLGRLIGRKSQFSRPPSH